MKFLEVEGWNEAQEKIHEHAFRINGGELEELVHPVPERLLMQLTTDTSAQDLFDSAYKASEGTYIVVTDHKIAILYSQNLDTNRIYGVKSKF